MNYQEFIERKSQCGGMTGFEPVWMPDMLFDFQRSLIEWGCKKGRAAIFADCGLGKTGMQLTYAENAVRKSNSRALILTPLAVASQTVREGEKFGIEVTHRKEGIEKNDRIVVTNYERLHYFNPSDFSCVVCDESSILKHYTGATQKQVTRFIGKIPYRLLCTATAAPNDYIELGTSAEALGELSHSEMLTRFFRQLDDKGQKKEAAEQEYAEKNVCHFAKLSFRVAQSIGQWRLKHHAVKMFWRWVASWARACRKPSDLGFCDDRFIIPPLIERNHVIMPSEPAEGFLFTLPACGLGEERIERKRTLSERCDFVAQLADHNRPVVIWCHMNAEGDLLEKTIKGSKQIAGKTPDDEKEEIYNEFASGNLRALIIKPKIGAWGLNWQHCSDVITFASHSYEQYYQSVRRCWRFGQKNPVTVDIVSTEGERRVSENMQRKAAQADVMFNTLVTEMKNAEIIRRTNEFTKKEELPKWL